MREPEQRWLWNWTALSAFNRTVLSADWAIKSLSSGASTLDSTFLAEAVSADLINSATFKHDNVAAASYCLVNNAGGNSAQHFITTQKQVERCVLSVLISFRNRTRIFGWRFKVSVPARQLKIKTLDIFFQKPCNKNTRNLQKKQGVWHSLNLTIQFSFCPTG